MEIIIPFRWTDKREDLFDRINYPFLDTLFPENVGVTISDDGSPLAIKRKLELLCKERGINYIYTNSEFQPVCMSRARNAAVVNVKSDYVFFQDADLCPYKGFYSDVLNEIKAQKIENDSANFLMFGVLYLSKDATKEFFNTPDEYRKSLFLNYFLEDDLSKIEKFSTGTSVTVFHRHYYLSRGGYDEEFVEWGYEDLEFNLRCIRFLKKFPLPENFLKDVGTFRSIDKYEGWKSLYRLFGDITFSKGIVMFHAWHEIDNDSSYMKKKAVNGELFLKKIKEFVAVGREPDVLPMSERGRTLCFSSTNPFIFNRKTAPFFGDLIFEDELKFNEDTIRYYILEQNINRVLFHNPYANENRLAIFNAVKEMGIDFLVVERGALRDSVFFDDTGFNADSSRYDEKYWMKDLSVEQFNFVKEYILEEKSIDESLENQGARIGSIALRKKLKIPSSKKIVFVPLQRPSDTVIKFFTKKIGGYDNFLNIISRAADILKRDFVFVLKRHPLENETPILKNVVYADDANIKDLLELSDKVLLLNSGVGVLALMYGKHVISCGESFYDSSKLVSKAHDVSSVVKCLSEDDPSEFINKLKFISYLINDFYSFGKFETKNIPWHEGGRMTITTKIDFYQINIPNLARVKYLIRRDLFKNSSILFDRYRSSFNKKNLALTSIDNLKSASKKNDIPQEKNNFNLDNKISGGNVLVSQEIVSIDKGREGLSNYRFNKKMKKLKDNPRRFFNDSKSSLVRLVGNLIGYK